MTFGRDPELMRSIAETTGMQIVCATGFHHEAIGGVPFYWQALGMDAIASLYIHEIRNGIGATGIKPGVVELATGDPPTELERDVMIPAAGIAARETGLPVITHCENSVGGDVQQDGLAAVGADLTRCVIGHQGQATSSEQHVAIAERGSFVGFDRVGWDTLTDDEHRADLVADMKAAGHLDAVCLSQDHLCCWRPPQMLPLPAAHGRTPHEMAALAREELFGRPHTHMFDTFWPRLSQRGFTRSEWDPILEDNPRRLFDR